MPSAPDPYLSADAHNRATRSLIQGFGIDVAVAVAITLMAAFDSASGWSDVQLAVLAFSLAKSIIQAAASFVMRRFADRASWIPTPLPPDD